MKKSLLTLGGICIAFATQAAEVPKVTIGGFIDTQVGYVKQKPVFNYMDPSIRNFKTSNYGITNDTKFDISVEGKFNANSKYGGRIRLNTDTSRDAQDDDDSVADKTMVFLESALFGRLEMGAYDSATKTMQVSANNIAVNPYGIDGYQQKWFGKKNIDGTNYNNKFIKWPELITNCDCVSFGNKVTYYTPKLAGFQLGVSYTPDVATHGTISLLKTIPTTENQNFKRVFDYGVSYENKYKDVELAVAFIGQHGKSKSLSIARSDLNAWEVGATLKFQGFSLGGSYSDWNKSATPVVKASNKKYGAKYWTLGIGYSYKDIGTSVTYFRGKRANVYPTGVPATTAQHDTGYNKNEYISTGIAYKAIPGFVPYVELSHFKAKLYGATINNRGYVTLVGSRLSF